MIDEPPRAGLAGGFVNRGTAQLVHSEAQIMRGEQSEHNRAAGGPFFDLLTAAELGQRWRVPGLGSANNPPDVLTQSRTYAWEGTFVSPGALRILTTGGLVDDP
jgi:hypothetical protein